MGVRLGLLVPTSERTNLVQLLAYTNTTARCTVPLKDKSKSWVVDVTGTTVQFCVINSVKLYHLHWLR
jgi:hypothetical protein